MASVMAIVSKKVFEKAHPNASIGDVLDFSAYHSSHKQLEPLADGGALFLVTVRPGERLWVVAILEQVRRENSSWVAADANRHPTTDATDLVSELKLASGKGITAKPGALGMSLQTPRQLTEQDCQLLRGQREKGARSKNAKRKAAKKNKAAKRRSPKNESPLEQLLAAWREAPAAPIAEAIAALGANAATQRDAALLSGKTPAAKKAWLEVVRKRDPADLSLLLASLTDVPSTDATKRMEALLDWPADPRIDMALARTLEAIPYRASSTQKFWRRLLKRARLIQDSRTLQILERLPAHYRADYQTTSGAWLRGQVEGILATLRPQLQQNATTIVAPEVQELIAAATAPLQSAAAADRRTGRDAAALLEQVLENPEDNALRLVCADALTERGDPRGELIVLQTQKLEQKLSSEARKREKVILRDHLKALLGPLHKVLRKKDLAFSRGFLSRCNLILKSPHDVGAVVGHPLWATVEHLDCSDDFGDAQVLPLIHHEVMRSLRSLDYGYWDVAPLVDGDRQLKITALACGVRHQEAKETLVALARARALPELTDLTTSIDEAQAGLLLDGPLARRLERLSLRSRLESVGRWIDQLYAHDLAISILELRLDADNRSDDWGSTFTFTIDSDGRYRQLHVLFDVPENTRGWVESNVASVVRALETLPADSLRVLTLKPRQRSISQPKTLDPIRRAVERFTGLERLDCP